MDGNLSKVILYPKRETEFEVQAELYCKLKKQGFNVRGNVKINDNRHLDLVVFDENNNDICIIEVKNWKLNCNFEKKFNRPRTKAQRKEYLKYNSNLEYCVHSAQIEMTIKRVQEIINNRI